MGLIEHLTNNLGEQVVRLTMSKFPANVKPALVMGAALGALLFSASGGGSVLAADLPAGFKAGELAPAPPADMIEAGKRVYFTKCVWCHGVDGAGDGPGADRLWPRPRNFNQGTFKIRHTASGELPLRDAWRRRLPRDSTTPLRYPACPLPPPAPSQPNARQPAEGETRLLRLPDRSARVRRRQPRSEWRREGRTMLD